MKTSASTKPIIILVGEAGHGDLSHGSLIENIAKYSQDKGLKFQIFSEFETQSQKIEVCKQRPEFPNKTPFINEPSDQSLRDTTAFLDKNFIPIGNLASREKLLEERFDEFKKQGLSASEVVDQIMHENGNKLGISPKMLEMLDPTKMTLEDLKAEWGAPLHYPQIHEQMIDDLQTKRSSDADVVIIVTGFGHSYGMDQKLQEQFPGIDRYAVTNFMKYQGPPDLELRKQIRFDEEKFAPIGNQGLLGFDVDAVTKQASIPSIIQEKLDEISHSKQYEQENKGGFVEKLGLEKQPDQQEKSFVERMRSDSTKGTSKGGSYEL